MGLAHINGLETDLLTLGYGTNGTLGYGTNGFLVVLAHAGGGTKPIQDGHVSNRIAVTNSPRPPPQITLEKLKNAAPPRKRG